MAHQVTSFPKRLPAVLRYGVAILSVAVATCLALVLRQFDIRVTPFLAAVATTVWYAGIGPGVLSIVLAVLCLGYFVIPLTDSPSPLSRGALFNFTLFALVVGWVAAARRRVEHELRQARDELDAKVSERTTDLKRSQARLEEAQRMAHVGHWERDLGANLVVWSDESARIFGLAPEQSPFAYARFQELVHPEDRQRTVTAAEEALCGGARFDVEYRVVRPNGEVRVVHSRGDVTRDESGRPRSMFGFFQDITERKRAEAALRESEQRYRYIFESTGVSIWEEDFSQVKAAIDDLKSKGVVDFPQYFAAHPEFIQQLISMVKIVDVNDVTLKLFAAESKDELLASLHKLFVPETREVFVGELIAIADGRTSFEAEAVLQTLKGERRSALITMTLPPPPAQFDSVLVTVTDLTERKRAEYLTGHVFESSPDAISIVGRDYRFQRVNPVQERFWEMPAGSMVGMHLAEILGREVFEQRGKPNLDRCFAGEEVSFAGWFTAPRGPTYKVITVSPLRPDSQRVEAALVIARDLTDFMHASEALRHAQTELAHANRVATMGQLTASIAHEVNQPIAAAATNAEAALRWLGARPPNPEEVRQALEHIVKDATRAGDVIGRIRELIQKAPSRKDWVDVNEAVREVIELTRNEAVKNGASVQTALAEGLPLIEGDRVQFQQVVLNLIVNAVQAMTAVAEGTRELFISTARAEPNGVLIAMKDSGPGLAPASLEHLFTPFYTTKPAGLGMGLSICRSIVEAHGGRLWVTPNVPQGAIFCFTVPTQRSARDSPPRR